MTPTDKIDQPRRGRPKLSKVKKLEHAVSKHFEALQALRQTLTQAIIRQYPSLTEEQQLEVCQPILAVAEEYRLWSELDNLLLGVQRHHNPNKQLQRQGSSIQLITLALEGSYQLVQSNKLETAQIAESPQTITLDALPDLLTSYQSKTVAEQTTLLHTVSIWLPNALFDSSNQCPIAQYRALIRAILLLILHQRLSLIYRIEPARRTGRPSLPLPIKVARTEQELIDTYLQLVEHYKQQNLVIKVPIEIWNELKQAKRKRAVGRPSLSGKAKLQRQLEIKQRELDQLIRHKEAIIEEDRNRSHSRGRKPLTYHEKAAKLYQAIRSIQDSIEK